MLSAAVQARVSRSAAVGPAARLLLAGASRVRAGAAAVVLVLGRADRPVRGHLRVLHRAAVLPRRKRRAGQRYVLGRSWETIGDLRASSGIFGRLRTSTDVYGRLRASSSIFEHLRIFGSSSSSIKSSSSSSSSSI